MEMIQEAVLSAVSLILVTLIGVITQSLVSWLKSKGVTEKLYQQKALVQAAVFSVEQEFKNANGKDKFEAAKARALIMLQENKINIKEEQLNIFIEEVVRAMKDGVRQGLEDDGKVQIESADIHLNGSVKMENTELDLEEIK